DVITNSGSWTGSGQAAQVLTRGLLGAGSGSRGTTPAAAGRAAGPRPAPRQTPGKRLLTAWEMYRAPNPCWHAPAAAHGPFPPRSRRLLQLVVLAVVRVLPGRRRGGDQLQPLDLLHHHTPGTGVLLRRQLQLTEHRLHQLNDLAGELLVDLDLLLGDRGHPGLVVVQPEVLGAAVHDPQQR